MHSPTALMLLGSRRFLKVVYGYHGTSKEQAFQIKKDGFQPSANKYDWLGDGTYFWQDAPSRAREWAQKHYPAAGAVVGARLTLSSDCMDLLDIDWFGQLEQAHALLLAEASRTGTHVPQQSASSLAHRLDSAVINYSTKVAASKGLKVTAVRAAFTEGTVVYPNSAIFNRAHVQICVIDNTVVDDIFIVR
ncbi:MAG: hypothetical protein ACXW5U_06855 [Thermoanaerobaculia bacterium]